MEEDLKLRVGGDISRYQAAMTRLVAETQSGVSQAGAAMAQLKVPFNNITETAAKVASETEKAFRTLGVRSSAAIKVEMEKITASLQQVFDAANAGQVSSRDLAVAQKAASDQMSVLSREAEGASSGVDKLNTAFTALGAVIAPIHPSLRILTSSLGLLFGKTGLIITGALVGAGVLKSFGSATAKAAEEVRQLAAFSGLETREATALRETFQVLGGDTEILTQLLFRLATDLESGGLQLKKAGIAARDAGGALKEPGEALLEFASRFPTFESATEKGARLMDLFGRAGRSTSVIFEQFAETFTRAMQQQGRITDDVIMRVVAYQRATKQLASAWEELQLTAGPAVLGFLTSVSNALRDFVKVMEEAAKSWQAFRNLFGFSTELEQAQGALAGIRTQMSLLQEVLKTGRTPGLPGLGPLQPEALERVREQLAKLIVEEQKQLALVKQLSEVPSIPTRVAQGLTEPEAQEALAKSLRQIQLAMNDALIQEARIRQQISQGIVSEIAGVDLLMAVTRRMVTLEEQRVQAAIRIEGQKKDPSEIRLLQLKNELLAVQGQNTAKLITKELERVAVGKRFIEALKPQLDLMDQGLKGVEEWTSADASLTAAQAALIRTLEAAKPSIEGMSKGLEGAEQAMTVTTSTIFKLTSAFDDELAIIAETAKGYQALGLQYDALGGQTQAVTTFVNNLSKAFQDKTITADQYRQALDKLFQTQQLLGTWNMVTNAVLGAIDTMVTGVLQGTQTMEQLFKNFVQNILLVLASAQLKKSLRPVLEDFSGEFKKFMAEAGKEGGNALGTAFGQSLALIGAGVIAGGLNKFNQDRGANQAAGDVGSSIGLIIGAAIGYALIAWVGPAGPVIGAVIGSALGGAIGRGVNKSIASIGPELQATLNEIFAPWFAQFQAQLDAQRAAMGTTGEALGEELMTGVQKGAEAIGLRSFVRALGFERMHADDFERLLKPILEATMNLTAKGLSAGLRAGTKEEGFEIFKKTLAQGALDAIVVALSQGVVFQSAMAPLMAVLATQTGQALIDGITLAVDFMVQRIAELEPVFNALFEAWQTIKEGIEGEFDVDFGGGGIAEVAVDVERILDDFLASLQAIMRQATETALAQRDYTAALASFDAEMALFQKRIDRARVALETAGGPEAAISAAGALMQLVEERYAREIELVTQLKERVDELIQAIADTVQRIIQLTLAFARSDADLSRLFRDLGRAFGVVQNVTVAIQLWLGALQVVMDALTRFAQGISGFSLAEIVEAFNAVFAALPGVIAEIQKQFAGNAQMQLTLLGQVAEGLQAAMQQGLQAAAIYYERQRDAVRTAFDDRMEQLRKERDAVQKMLQATQEWKQLADSIRQTILDLRKRFEPGGPGGGRLFGELQAQFTGLMAQFQAGPTPALADSIRILAAQLLEAGAEIFTRPSPEFQAIFASVMGGLDLVSGFAEDQAATLTDLELQLEQIDATIKAEQDALRATLDRITQEEQATLQSIRDTFAAQFEIVRQAMITALLELAEQQRQAADALQKIIGEGNTFEAFIAQKQAEQVAVLHQIHQDLAAILEAMGIAVPLQHGLWKVPQDMTVRVHRDEMIMPKEPAESIRSGDGGLSRTTYIVQVDREAVVVHSYGSASPREIGEEVLDQFLVNLRRGGKMRKVIQGLTK